MKIHNERPVNVQVSGQNVKKVTEEQAISIERKAGDQSFSKDRVDISEKAKEAARLMEEIKAIPEIREQRVEELREAIKSGRYRIDSVKLAERILREI